MTEEQRTILAGYMEEIPDTFIDSVYFVGMTAGYPTLCVKIVQKDATTGKWFLYVDQIDHEGRTTVNQCELKPGAFGLPVEEQA